MTISSNSNTNGKLRQEEIPEIAVLSLFESVVTTLDARRQWPSGHCEIVKQGTMLNGRRRWFIELRNTNRGTLAIQLRIIHGLQPIFESQKENFAVLTADGWRQSLNFFDFKLWHRAVGEAKNVRLNGRLVG